MKNELVLKQMGRTYKCAQALEGMGIKINTVDLKGRNPRLVVQNSPACTALKAVSKKRTIGLQGRQHQMAATLEGCQVEYTVRGH